MGVTRQQAKIVGKAAALCVASAAETSLNDEGWVMREGDDVILSSP